MKHKIHMLRQAIQEVSARTITLHIRVTINGTFILKKKHEMSIGTFETIGIEV